MSALRFSILGLIVLTGCATSVMTLEGRMLRLDSQSFRDDLERGFREQNEAATALAFAQDEATASLYDLLVEVEIALFQACAELNALAIAHRVDQALGLQQQARMAATTPE